MENRGTIKQITGQVVEVEFRMEKPQINDLLVVENDTSVILEVAASATATSFYCFALSPSQQLARGTVVINTRHSIEIPVGQEVLGRVMNLFGQPLDEKGDIVTKERK